MTVQSRPAIATQTLLIVDLFLSVAFAQLPPELAAPRPVELNPSIPLLGCVRMCVSFCVCVNKMFALMSSCKRK
jgi:hypothetical protein